MCVVKVFAVIQNQHLCLVAVCVFSSGMLFFPQIVLVLVLRPGWCKSVAGQVTTQITAAAWCGVVGMVQAVTAAITLDPWWIWYRHLSWVLGHHHIIYSAAGLTSHLRLNFLKKLLDKILQAEKLKGWVTLKMCELWSHMGPGSPGGHPGCGQQLLG